MRGVCRREVEGSNLVAAVVAGVYTQLYSHIHRVANECLTQKAITKAASGAAQRKMSDGIGRFKMRWELPLSQTIKVLTYLDSVPMVERASCENNVLHFDVRIGYYKSVAQALPDLTRQMALKRLERDMDSLYLMRLTEGLQASSDEHALRILQKPDTPCPDSEALQFSAGTDLIVCRHPWPVSALATILRSFINISGRGRAKCKLLKMYKSTSGMFTLVVKVPHAERLLVPTQLKCTRVHIKKALTMIALAGEFEYSDETLGATVDHHLARNTKADYLDWCGGFVSMPLSSVRTEPWRERFLQKICQAVTVSCTEQGTTYLLTWRPAKWTLWEASVILYGIDLMKHEGEDGISVNATNSGVTWSIAKRCQPMPRTHLGPLLENWVARIQQTPEPFYKFLLKRLPAFVENDPAVQLAFDEFDEGERQASGSLSNWVHIPYTGVWPPTQDLYFIQSREPLAELIALMHCVEHRKVEIHLYDVVWIESSTGPYHFVIGVPAGAPVQEWLGEPRRISIENFLLPAWRVFCTMKHRRQKPVESAAPVNV